MEFNAQKVLLAIYTEYKKDISDMDKNIKPETVGISLEAFKIAVGKLENEKLIKGTDLRRGGQGNKILIVYLRDTTMTQYGIDHVEQKLLIQLGK